MEKHDKADVKADKKMIASAVHKHEKKMHPGKPMTKLAKGGKTTMSNLRAVPASKNRSFARTKTARMK